MADTIDTPLNCLKYEHTSTTKDTETCIHVVHCIIEFNKHENKARYA